MLVLKRQKPILILFLLLAMLLAGCATPLRTVDEKTVTLVGGGRVRLGPVITLHQGKTGRIRVAVDGAGQAHVLLAGGRPNRLHYVVADSRGVTHQGVFGPPKPSSIFDLAIDSDHCPHVIAREGHWIRRDGTWSSAPPPWQGMAEPKEIEEIVCNHDGQGVCCAMLVHGSAFNSPSRWIVEGAGGYGGAAIWAYPVRPDKLAVSRLDEYGRWLKPQVLDPQSRITSRNPLLAADGTGGIHLAWYTEGGSFLAPPHQQSCYARLKPPAVSDRPWQIQQQFIENANWGAFALAADSASDLALLMYQKIGFMYPREMAIARGGSIQEKFPFPKEGIGSGQILAPTGNERFWALNFFPRFWSLSSVCPIKINLLENGRWSEPIDLGDAQASGRDGYAIAIGPDGKAFAVWRVPNGLAGRWIERQ